MTSEMEGKVCPMVSVVPHNSPHGYGRGLKPTNFEGPCPYYPEYIVENEACPNQSKCNIYKRHDVLSGF